MQKNVNVFCFNTKWTNLVLFMRWNKSYFIHERSAIRNGVFSLCNFVLPVTESLRHNNFVREKNAHISEFKVFFLIVCSVLLMHGHSVCLLLIQVKMAPCMICGAYFRCFFKILFGDLRWKSYRFYISFFFVFCSFLNLKLVLF